jgi:hypothetical protein
MRLQSRTEASVTTSFVNNRTVITNVRVVRVAVRTDIVKGVLSPLICLGGQGVHFSHCFAPLFLFFIEIIKNWPMCASHFQESVDAILG